MAYVVQEAEDGEVEGQRHYAAIPRAPLGARGQVAGRVVLHVDCDCFFLAVHERLDNSLRGIPVALWQVSEHVYSHFCTHVSQHLSAQMSMHTSTHRAFSHVHADLPAHLPTYPHIRLRACLCTRRCACAHTATQYNDVVCMNHLAKAAGVRKHHYPDAAREKLKPVGGRSITMHMWMHMSMRTPAHKQ